MPATGFESSLLVCVWHPSCTYPDVLVRETFWYPAA